MDKRVAKLTAEATSTQNKIRKQYFAPDLPWMMYGFGDDKAPLKETVDLLDEVVSQYVEDLARQALAITTRKTGGFKLEDLLYVMRRDRKKHTRARRMLLAKEKIADARDGGVKEKSMDEPSD